MTDSVWERIERSRARHNVLDHPFYRRWSAGELSAEELARYAGQYRHAAEAIARLSAQAAEEAPPAAREELRLHAAEEESHVGLWDGFVEAAGGEIGAKPTEGTADCVSTWTASSGYLASLARLYAIESGQPEISRIKREGLSDYYGIDGGRGTEYFRIHERVDRAHAADDRRRVEQSMSPADQDAVVAEAEAAFRANWRLLDDID